MSKDNLPKPITVVRGEDPEPNPWDEALSLARTTDEVRELREADSNGSLMELLDRWRRREDEEKSR